MNYREFVASRFKSGRRLLDDATITTLDHDASAQAFSLLHAAIGVVGELHEYRRSPTQKNAREELGDALFYMVAGELAIDADPAQLPIEWGGAGYAAAEEALTNAETLAHVLLDKCKKYALYCKPVDVDYLRRMLWALRCELRALADREGVSLETLEVLNRQKLEKRYPAGYSNEAAQARADKEAGE
jgi:hypothetical protein